MTPSLSMRAAAFYLRVRWKREGDTPAFRRRYLERAYPPHAPVARSLHAIAEVREDRVGGYPVFTVTPRGGASGRHVIYTHGGAYVNALQKAHWHIVRELVRATGAAVTVPIYPLAPEHTWRQGYAFLEEVYRSVIARIAAERVVLCGDSAGGGLAIGQAMAYRDGGLPLPGHLILFAPWLDVTLANPEAARIEPRDVMLQISRLRRAGEWWAGGDDPRAPLVSPLFGDPRGLPPIMIFQGTDDLLAPDTRTLRDQVARAGGRIHLHEARGAFHVYMGATFTPEARAAFREVARVLGV